MFSARQIRPQIKQRSVYCLRPPLPVDKCIGYGCLDGLLTRTLHERCLIHPETPVRPATDLGFYAQNVSHFGRMQILNAYLRHHMKYFSMVNRCDQVIVFKVLPACRFQQFNITGVVDMTKSIDRVHLLWHASHMGFPEHPDLSEALLCIYYLILEHLTQGRLNPIEVRFTHSGTTDKGVYRQVFQAPIRFGAKRDELIVAAESLNLPIDLANRELFELLESHAIRIANTLGKVNPWTDKVIGRISSMVVKGINPTLDSVSKQLALSRRSLQAKLNAEQTTFRNCLETVRKQVALDYLARPEFSVCDIGFLLGYSEQSAFNHAFKRWTGKSPIDFRKETSRV